MSNLKNLKTKHYISKIFKWYQKNPKIDFNFKGLSYINIKDIPESTLQSI